MKKKLSLGLFALVFSLISGSALAQDYEYHPALSDSFHVSAGWFKSDNTFKVSLNGVDADWPEIDFGDDVGVDSTNSILNFQLRWNYGSEDQWSLWGQYFKNKADGDATLEEDIEWGNVIFREGTFVGAGVSVEVIRLFAGYSFIKNDRSDLGAGFGIHNLDLSAFIEGEILINDEGTGFHRGDGSTSAPLPNLGAWYFFSPAKKWLLHARVDWISANIDAYDGTLWNANVGVNYQFFRNFGVDLAYQYFNLNLGIDKSSWNGSADMTYSGPVISLTANW